MTIECSQNVHTIVAVSYTHLDVYKRQVMEPAKVVPSFGTLEKPECHMLYNVTTMASTWHTVATKEVALLKQQMDRCV